MAIKVTARHMEGGYGHEHIAAVKWLNDITGQTGESSREAMVKFVGEHVNQAVWCPDRHNSHVRAWVKVNSNGRIRYIQTVADDRWTDNLLSLQTY